MIRSKAQVTTDELGDQYIMMGPYNESLVRTEVEVLEPETEMMQEAVRALNQHGIRVITGRWLIDGYPQVLLFDIGSAAYKLDEWKADFFEVSGIGVPHHDREANDAILFGYCVSWFLSEFHSALEKRLPDPLIAAHFHEWLAAVGLVLCRSSSRRCRSWNARTRQAGMGVDREDSGCASPDPSRSRLRPPPRDPRRRPLQRRETAMMRRRTRKQPSRKKRRNNSSRLAIPMASEVLALRAIVPVLVASRFYTLSLTSR